MHSVSCCSVQARQNEFWYTQICNCGTVVKPSNWQLRHHMLESLPLHHCVYHLCGACKSIVKWHNKFKVGLNLKAINSNNSIQFYNTFSRSKVTVTRPQSQNHEMCHCHTLTGWVNGWFKLDSTEVWMLQVGNTTYRLKLTRLRTINDA